ncbi:MAG: hypothetical protein PVF27_09675 [Gemmatimonadales bacterium]|jgi:hypothetical protein
MTGRGPTLAVLGVLALSCADPTGVERAAGTFVLAALDGAGPPFTVADTLPSGTVLTTTYADTVRFYADSVFRRAFAVEVTADEGSGPERVSLATDEWWGRFYVAADGAMVTVWRGFFEDETEVLTLEDDSTLVRCGWIGVPCADTLETVEFTLRKRET